MPSTLPAAPVQLLSRHGQPAFGVYQGQLPALNWQALAHTPWQKLRLQLHHKRWQYAAIAHPDFFIGAAVVDVGWNGTAFAYLFDRRQGRLLADCSGNGIPGVSTRVANRAFGDASFRRGRLHLAFQRRGDVLQLTIRSPQLQLDAAIDLHAMPPVLLAIAPANYLAHTTHKSGGLALSGRVQTAAGEQALDAAVASLDYSNGLLARETRWRWASAHGHGIGFNLQQGYMGAAENAVWLAGKLFRVGAVEFDYDAAAPLAPWRIRSADGLVDLAFTPEGARREDKNLLIAMSRYLQPIGRFDGTLVDPDSGARHRVSQLAGVTEDHVSRW